MSTPTPSIDSIRDELIQLLTECNSPMASAPIKPESTLDNEIGLDSLTRIEFCQRIEKKYHIRFTEAQLADINSCADLLRAIRTDAKSPTVTARLSAAVGNTQVCVDDCASLIEVLQAYGTQEPHRLHVILHDDHGEETPILYGELYNEAKKVAAGLQYKGIKPLQTVAIMLPTSADFFSCFFGIQLAGAIPVPIYPPLRLNQIELFAQRAAKILNNAQAKCLITFDASRPLANLLKMLVPECRWVTTAQIVKRIGNEYQETVVKALQPGLVQYTSGSTQDPKGVVLTHQNLLSNIRAYGKAIAIQANDRVVSWLPLYHDMGLIGSWLGSVYYGVPALIMSPLAFLARPANWLLAIDRHRATISGSPNFAYELCLNKIDAEEIKGIDLSCWRLAFNGAEAINPLTIERFYARFAQYGLKANAMTPVYGLAECTVGLSISSLDSPPIIDTIQRDAFESRQEIIIATDEEPHLQFVSCGHPLPEHKVRIVDKNDQPLPDCHVGEIEFSGPSTMQGYLNNKIVTEQVFDHGWTRTGDLGYLRNGQVYITGRKKDLIIKAGRNITADSIEQAVQTVKGVRKGCVVAFSDKNTLGTERLIVIAETNQASSALQQEIIKQIQQYASVTADEVILCQPHSIPKTSSGKLQRSLCKEKYRSNTLHPEKASIFRQIISVTYAAMRQYVTSFISKLLKVGYSLYVVAVYVLMSPVVWLIITLPTQKVARKLTKKVARTVINLLSFFRFSITEVGAEHSDKTVIYVANHASYLDAIILLAALPEEISIVSKIELEKTVFLSRYLKKLGHVTVQRDHFSKSVADFSKIQAVLQQRSIAIFPEGTFEYRPGLRDFKMGAFILAAHCQTPVIPVCISGSRQFMQADSYLFHPMTITVTIDKPLQAQGNDWHAALSLKQQVRRQILRYCQEPSISW